MLARYARQVRELGADVVRLRRALASCDRPAQLAERVALFAPHAEKTFEQLDRRTVRNSSVD